MEESPVVVNIKFKAEAFFDVVIEMKPSDLQRLRERVGSSGKLLTNDKEDDRWARFLIADAEFDYVDTTNTDVEEITIEEQDRRANYPASSETRLPVPSNTESPESFHLP